MKTLYFGNFVDEGIVTEVKEVCDKEGAVCVSFAVIGRTRHEYLGAELHHMLGDEYEADIEYWTYKVEIRKKGGTQ